MTICGSYPFKKQFDFPWFFLDIDCSRLHDHSGDGGFGRKRAPAAREAAEESARDLTANSAEAL